eukprot:223542_1
MATQQQQTLLIHGYIRRKMSFKRSCVVSNKIYDTIQRYCEWKHITIGLCGTFRTGKSTLGGRIVYEFNHKDHIDKDVVATPTPSDERWASYFDADEAEQIQQMTIHGNIHEVYTLSYQISLIDMPGHNQYMKNFMRYISMTDVVIIVFAADDLMEKKALTHMPSTPNIDKLSFDGYYELLDKLRICHLFNIKQVIVAVNKLDKFNYEKAKYMECKSEIEKMLKLVGYPSKNKTPIIPISAINGDNILYKSNHYRLKWWTKEGYKKEVGKTLTKPSSNKRRTFNIEYDYDDIYTIFEAIEHICFSEIQIYKDNIINLKPFRMSICHMFEETLNGSIVSGRIENGRISTGNIVKCFPSGCCGQIKSIEMFHKGCSVASYGDIVGISLDSFLLHPQRGDIIIKENNVKEQDNFSGIASFEALVDVYPSKDKIGKKYRKAKYNKKLRGYRNGFSPIIYTNNAIRQCQCQIIDIIWKINKSITISANPGQETKIFQQKDTNAQYLQSGDTAKVLFEPHRQFAISTMQKVVVFEHKQMIMSGKVVKLHFADEIIEDLK